MINREDIEQITFATIGKYCKNKCGGFGFLLEGKVIKNCECTKEFSKQVKLIKSGIPRKYWDFDFRNLLKSFIEDNSLSLGIIKKYCDNVKESTEYGIGLYIQGTYGLAKSSLAYYILKEALKEDIPCMAIRMSQLTKLLFDATFDKNKQEYVNNIKKRVKLLMIDEIEKDYKIDDLSRFGSIQVNDFFGEIYDQKKSLIVTSNVPKEGLKGAHAKNVIDRLNELVDVILVGESFRKPDESINRLLGL